MRGLRRLLIGEKTPPVEVVLEAAEKLARNEVEGGNEQAAMRDWIYDAAANLSEDERKTLALRLVSLGRSLARSTELPEGYTPGFYVSSKRGYPYLRDETLRIMVLGPGYARDRGLVVARILAETQWSLPELENLLVESGGPFVPVYWKLWGFQRETAYGNGLWPWGVGPFVERLSEQEGEPGYAALLTRFLVEIFSRVYPGLPLGDVATVLGVVHRRPESGHALFARIEEIEAERLAFVEAFDLRRVEIRLRAQLTHQIWNLLNRSSCRVADPDGAYARALAKVCFPGQKEYLAALDEMLAESTYGISGSDGNLFTGEDCFAENSWIEPSWYLEKLRSLADLGEVPEDAAPSESLLAMFEPEELQRQFWNTEMAWSSDTSDRWLASLEVLGPETTGALLHGLYSLASRPENGERIWTDATTGIRPEAVREFCRMAWANRAWKLFDAGPTLKYWDYFSWSSKLRASAVRGVAEVADAKVCEELGEIVLDHRAHDDEVVELAIEALDRIGGLVAHEQLEKSASRLHHKPFLKRVMETLSRSGSVDVEVLRDKHAVNAGVGQDGKRSWKVGPYEAWVCLREDGTVLHVYVDPKTGEKIRRLPREVYESSPEVPREIAICKGRLRDSYHRQRERMKEAVVSGRRWSPEEWRAIFTENPVMINLATRLVWELLYETGRTLAVPDVDGAWTDARGGLVPAGWRGVRLTNPERISEAELETWKNVVSAWNAPQPFEQMPQSTGSA